MKYFKAVFCTVLVAVLLSGCSFHISSSIEDLISPVSPFGDNAYVQEALDSYAPKGYSLKTPSGGDYIASYNFYDIDKDGDDEAFVFYEPADNLGSISMALIKKLDSKWTVVQNVDGDGKDVYSIDFADVNDDDKDEILICWNVISNSSNHTLSVYNVSGENKKIKLDIIGKPVSVNNYIVVDFKKDKANELVLFEINSAVPSAKAELYSLKNNSFALLGETKLDSHITSYVNLKIEEAENDVRVYADAIGSDGSLMLTEIIYWSDSYDSIISPFYSYSTGITRDTRRTVKINSGDVNGDKLIEIPTDYKMKKLPKNIKAVDWKIYKNTVLVHSNYSLAVENDGYMVMLPDKVIDEISVSYNSKERLMTVKNKSTKKTVFSIKPVLKVSYDEKDYSDYKKVYEASGYCYLAREGNDSDIRITIKDLPQCVKLLN